ncbi:cell wall metabolism sensor histidine kinase WalK [Nocardia sp. BMG51109]|uniref:sensor histidine kinase n=1 Tax=Nocardia sp. BMG51109 TaxID=1056816 RepID=UPI0004AD40C0|nr:HAMP domain-containing sensor histidine kinase [Nocardia sp. BMG51109]
MRARTTVASTAVVAVALVAAGLALLGVLRDNLVDSASMQAEMTAREVATRVESGADLPTLNLPDPDTQPVQVVSADGRVLAADHDLPLHGPMADFAPLAATPTAFGGNGSGARSGSGTPNGSGAHQDSDNDEEDEEDDEDEHDADEHDADHKQDGNDKNGGEPVAGSTVSPSTADVTFRDMQLPVDDDGPQPFQVAALVSHTPDGRPVAIYAGTSLETADNAVSGVRGAMLIGLPLLLALIAAMTWLVTRRALRPVEGIRSELVEIMHGDLSRRVPVPSSRDEIARLASTTNDTLTALEESSERQRRFVADAAHELRSPIASLRTQLEVARAHPQLLELDSLIDDTVRLEHLAADLLLLARIDAGEQPRRDPVDLAALIRDQVASRAGDRHRVEVRAPADPVVVLGSRMQLGRVLANLIDNAQRHAVTTVRVELSQTIDTAVVDVTDDGSGVPQADRDRIFQRFVRLDDARSRDEGGAGLGLAIVRDVVERHQGRIEVGDGPQAGARFTITLPLAAPAPV